MTPAGVGRAAGRAISAFRLQEKVFKQQLTYTKNPRIPSSLNILPMALNTPLPRKEKSCECAELFHICPVQPHMHPRAPSHGSASPATIPAEGSLFCLLSSDQAGLKEGRVCTLPVCSDTWENTQPAHNCSMLKVQELCEAL